MSEQVHDREALVVAHIRVPEQVVFRTFEAETVLLNLQTGRYHGLNATGTRMLELLGETGSVAATAEAVAAEYDASLGAVTQDVIQLCRDLVERGLIEVDAPAA